jgi:hypothetical protein
MTTRTTHPKSASRLVARLADPRMWNGPRALTNLVGLAILIACALAVGA